MSPTSASAGRNGVSNNSSISKRKPSKRRGGWRRPHTTAAGSVLSAAGSREALVAAACRTQYRRRRSWLRSRTPSCRARDCRRTAPDPSQPSPAEPPRGAGARRPATECPPVSRRLSLERARSGPVGRAAGRSRCEPRGPSGREPVPPHLAAFEMAARRRGSPSNTRPPLPGETHLRTAARRGARALRPPRRGAALLSPEHGEAGARVEKGASTAPPPASGRRGHRFLRSCGGAARTPSSRREGLIKGWLARSPARHSANPSASQKCRRRLCGTRQRVSRRAEGAAPPLTGTRPLLPAVRQPSPRAGATSPLCRRRLARSPLRPVARPPGAWLRRGRVASPALFPAALLRLLRLSSPTAGKSKRQLPSGRRGQERSGAAGGSDSAQRLSLRGWTGLRPAPQLARGEEGGNRPPSPPRRRGTPVKCHGSPFAPRRHPAHRSPREGAVKVAAEAALAAARPPAARRKGAPGQLPGVQRNTRFQWPLKISEQWSWKTWQKTLLSFLLVSMEPGLQGAVIVFRT
nr:serine/arginine repetitive matrix protein 2-like [Taeniopygia guttata]